MARIFIVEDEDSISEMVSYALNSSGFETEAFARGADFFARLDEMPPNLVLLDVMLPDMDGLEILRRLRQSPEHKTLPVVMLTARSGEFDKVKGLDLGADDYVAKPFGVLELISRIKAVLRRSGESAPAQSLTYKDIALDASRRAVFVGEAKITLTFKEFELLHYLLQNTDIVLTRDKIINTVWGYDFHGESRTVNMHIKTLRQKLGAAGEHIKTVRNVGYKIGE